MGERLEILITAEDAASGVLSGLKGAASGLGDVFGGLLTLGAGAATAGIGALGAITALSFKEAMDAQEIASSLNQTLANTGKVTGVTAEMCNSLADGLSKVTRFSDDAILAGEDVLASFNNIGKNTFPNATKAMLDMATRMKTDVPSAAKLMGKILNDPIGASGLLEKQGIKLTDALQAQIKKMTEAGDVAGAQKLILEQLGATMGGAAEAAGETFAGRLDILKNRLLNVAEGIGTNLLPIAEQFFNNVIMPAVPLIEQLAAQFSALIQTFAGGDFSAITNLLPPEVMAQIQPFIDSVQNLANAFIEKMPQMQAAGENFTTWLQGAFTIIGPQIMANLTTALNSMAEFWRAHGDQIIAIVTFVFQILIATIGGALTLLSGIISAALQLLNGDWQGAWQTMQDTFASFMNLVLSIVGTNLEEFTTVWRNNWNMLQLIVSTVTMQITSGFQTWIINLINTLQGYYATFRELGVGLVNHMLLGITSMVAQVLNTVTDMVKNAIAAAGRALGDVNPFSGGVGVPGFATGGGFTVGGSGGTDSQLVAFKATPGEIVNISRPGQAGTGGQEIHNHFHVSDALDVEIVARRVVQLIAGA